MPVIMVIVLLASSGVSIINLRRTLLNSYYISFPSNIKHLAPVARPFLYKMAMKKIPFTLDHLLLFIFHKSFNIKSMKRINDQEKLKYEKYFFIYRLQYIIYWHCFSPIVLMTLTLVNSAHTH